MFDAFKNMGAIAALMQNKERLAEAGARVRERLAETTVEGRSGSVRVVATAEMRIVEIDMGDGAPAAVVADATNDALMRARAAMAVIVAEEIDRMGLPPLPGDITKLLG